MEKLKSGIVWTVLSVGLCIAPLFISAQELPGNVEIATQISDSESTVLDLLPDLERPGNQVSEDLLKSRFTSLEKQIPLVYHEVSHQFVEYFIYKRANFTRQMLERKGLYFPLYEKALAKHNLPDELKYLSMIESGLDPKVISRAGAGGLWQFMRATGREFGLKQDAYIDERFDPVKATDAACRYLKQLYRIFGDWELALASYNAGPGSVKRAMRRSGGNSFWTVYNSLPKETRNYVPQFVAMIYMMHFYSDHGGFAHEPEYPIASDTLNIKGYLNLNTFASLSGITLDEIRKLNPQILTAVLPAYTDNFTLKVPAVKLSMVKDELVAIRDSSSKMSSDQKMLAAEDDHDAQFSTTKLVHKVRGGETLGQIANKYRVSVTQLKQWNGMRRNSLKKGQRIAIIRKVRMPRTVQPEPKMEETLVASISNRPTASLAEESPRGAETKARATGSDTEPASETSHGLTKTIHTVRAGESLLAIAGKYGITLQDLQGWNNVEGGELKPGQQLTIVKAAESTQPVPEKIYYTKSKAPKEQLPVDVKGNITTIATGGRHTVQKGESLFSIASSYKISVKELKEMNQLKTTKLTLGQKLVVSGGGEEKSHSPVVRREEMVAVKIKPRFHKVQRGDTLWTISQRYGLTVDFLKKANKIHGNNLKLGMKLLVSG